MAANVNLLDSLDVSGTWQQVSQDPLSAMYVVSMILEHGGKVAVTTNSEDHLEM